MVLRLTFNVVFQLLNLLVSYFGCSVHVSIVKKFNKRNVHLNGETIRFLCCDSIGYNFEQIFKGNRSLSRFLQNFRGQSQEIHYECVKCTFH